MLNNKDSAKQYPLAAKINNEYTEIKMGAAVLGRGFTVIAGPCAVEAGDSLDMTAEAVRAAGADILRAGAYKPRTSPYSFSGLGRDGIKKLLSIRDKYGLPFVTELTSPEQLKYFHGVDMIQIGARNMQNFELLRAVGKLDTPVLLKRGFGCTVTELLMAAEYILSGGNENVVLCERGIRTFEPSARATLDMSAVPILKRETHLPVIVDPSHAAGDYTIVEPLALAAAAAGADGIMLECHYNPAASIVDASQTVTPDVLADIIVKCRKIHDIVVK